MGAESRSVTAEPSERVSGARQAPNPNFASALDNIPKPTETLVGVGTLAHPGCLIEIDAIAVLEDP